MLLGFKRRFAPMVEDGSKTHTIRGERKITPEPGEICHCYVDPRQKTMRLLGRWECVKVERIMIDRSMYPGRLLVRIEGLLIENDEADALFFRDGFRDLSGETFQHMAQARDFWEDRLPFRGHLIHWKYTQASNLSTGCPSQVPQGRKSKVKPQKARPK